jgi:imidazolonepropionase-like amidohydrolase
MEAHRDRLFMAPAPGLLYARCYEAEAFGIDKAKAERMGAFFGLEANARIVPEMRKRGIRVLPGGDYGFPYNPVGRNARDLEIFVDLLGFTPVDALVAATRHGGELMGLPVGEIKAGMLADILLVDGDPTTDVTILQDKARIPAVMQGGRFHRAPAGETRRAA